VNLFVNLVFFAEKPVVALTWSYGHLTVSLLNVYLPKDGWVVVVRMNC